jgi:peptidase M28-like protein
MVSGPLIVLFDLGDTLEDRERGVLLPDARKALAAIQAMRDPRGAAPILALVSDFDMPDGPAQIPAIRERYFAILEGLGIRNFFEPVAKRVTLSTEVGVFKPDKRVFQAAVKKIDRRLALSNAVFITENSAHVEKARLLGMKAIHFKGPRETTGDVDRLVDLIPLIRKFLIRIPPATSDERGRAEGPDVKLARYQAPTNVRAGRFDLALPRGASWVRFGSEVLVYGDRAQWKELEERARRGQLQRRGRASDVKKDRLHIVVQNGRLFQQEHPEVPVIVDRGRFLLVELDPRLARRLGREGPTCYGVRPLGKNKVVFDVRAPSTARAAPVAWIQSLVDRISRPSFQADLARLVSFPTRFSTSAHYASAAAQARNQLTAMGYATKFQNITVNGGASRNVVADKKGAAPGARKLVLVTAHLDSINLQGGPAASAPGADDNGSGSAGLLEIARAFRDHHSKHDLSFILFGGEEEGLFGSKQYVARLSPSQRARIQAVVNMDMIASLNTSTQSVLLEGATLSQTVMSGLSEAAATYTHLTVETSLQPFASDHVPFINRGLPAVLTIEGADNANSRIHSSNDTIDRVNPEFALEILRMNVAFVAGKVGRMS